MIALLSLAALAAPPAPTDLDGDGKPESIRIGDAAVSVGRATIACGEEYGEPCTATVVDLRTSDDQKELVVCAFGMRDAVDCSVYTYRSKRVVPIPFSDGAEPPEILSNGSGIVRTRAWQDRIYTRIEKYVLTGDRLVRVAQPFFAADETVHIDRTFPITLEPGGGAVVANVAPDSDITVVLEHGTLDDRYLITVSSGLMGWVERKILVNASDTLLSVMAAG